MGFFQILEIHILNKVNKNPALFMTPILAEKVGFELGQMVDFKVGSLSVPVRIHHLKGVSDECIYLSRNLYKRCPMVNGAKLRFYLDSVKKLIRIGPVVGLLITLNSRGLPGTYREWIAEGYRKGLLTFVFSVNSLHKNFKRLKGLTYLPFRGGNCWVKKSFPLPDVVYNQIRSRRVEALPKVKTFRQRFLTAGDTHYFNRSFLNKALVAKALQDCEELKLHLPETRQLKSYRDCLEMLERFSSVFLKPIHGSLGRGIIKFTRPDLACYRYQAFAGRQKTKGKAVAAESLASVVKRLTFGRGYLIQQGIPLLTIEGRPFDIRVLIQKNCFGNWVETHMFAKIAAKGNFATNVAAGGEVASVQQALAEAAKQAGVTTEVLAESIRHLVFTVAQALEEKLGPFGELGLDIGIDNKGLVWLIEVNSKYSRHVFPREIRMISILRNLEYASWLTGLDETTKDDDSV
ncbi:MAG: YheC/YheD family endospore coat-associated protein [Thermincolia bacterium]